MSRSGDWYIQTKGDDEMIDDSDYDMWMKEQKELEPLRKEAEESIKRFFEYRINALAVGGERKDIVDAVFHDVAFHDAIWKASTEILPALEVQVVVDGENNCHVTTGSAGYVEFGMQPPVGMKLPIRCWIHTHPFGAAYFSGTDIRTVSIWESMMECAYVLGSSGQKGHYGFWSQQRPKELDIFENGEPVRTQTWGKKEEEE